MIIETKNMIDQAGGIEIGHDVKPDKKGNEIKEKEVPSAVARAEWQNLLDKDGLKDPDRIKSAKEQRLQKIEELKKNAANNREKESWLNNPLKEGGWPESMVKGRISGKLEDALKDKLGQIQEFGLSQAALETFKTAVIDHIYDCYKKNGNDDSITENYVNNNLLPKATFLFNGLTEIYKNKIYPFTNPFDCLQKFSDFSGLNFVQGDNFSLTGLKNLMEGTQNQYNNALTNFRNSLPYLREAQQLDEALKSLTTKGAEQPIEKPQVEQAPQQNKDQTLPKAENPATPSKAPNNQTEGPKTPNVPETPKAQPEKPTTTVTEQPKPPTTPQAALTATPDASPTSTPQTAPKDEPIKTGVDFLDKLIKVAEKFIPRSFIRELLSSIGLLKPENVMAKLLLSPEEQKEAAELQEILKKDPYALSEATLKKLFEDQKKFKNILDTKHEKKLDWPNYLAQYLDETEKNDLKNNSSLTAEEITNRFLSENPKPATIPNEGHQNSQTSVNQDNSGPT